VTETYFIANDMTLYWNKPSFCYKRYNRYFTSFLWQGAVVVVIVW